MTPSYPAFPTACLIDVPVLDPAKAKAHAVEEILLATGVSCPLAPPGISVDVQFHPAGAGCKLPATKYLRWGLVKRGRCGRGIDIGFNVRPITTVITAVRSLSIVAGSSRRSLVVVVAGVNFRNL